MAEWDMLAMWSAALKVVGAAGDAEAVAAAAFAAFGAASFFRQFTS